MYKSFKFELHPSKLQAEKLEQFFGANRYIYNWALNLKQKAYKIYGINLSAFDVNKRVTQKKRTSRYDWLNEVPSQSFQCTTRNLDTAYKAFFKKNAQFPRYKSKRNKQSFQVSQGVKIKDSKIFVPKIGLVQFHLSREVEGTIKTSTFSKTPSGRYFVSLLCEVDRELPKKKPITRNTSVGLDLGIKNFIHTSKDEQFENQKLLNKYQRRMMIEQRSLARKQKGSKRKEKQRLVVAKLHEKIANTRNDFQHKVSKKLVDTYNTIFLEDLSVRTMLSNGTTSLNRNIADAAWSSFIEKLRYKCEWYGVNFVQVDKYFPSTKMCSCCGATKDTISLSERTYNCKKCGSSLDRDLNAAINILNEGYRLVSSPVNVER